MGVALLPARLGAQKITSPGRCPSGFVCWQHERLRKRHNRKPPGTAEPRTGPRYVCDDVLDTPKVKILWLSMIRRITKPTLAGAPAQGRSPGVGGNWSRFAKVTLCKADVNQLLDRQTCMSLAPTVAHSVGCRLRYDLMEVELLLRGSGNPDKATP
jgi:hypothetical protein